MMQSKSMRIALSGMVLAAAAACAQADSLYKPHSFQALTSDRKAAAVGDVLTVQVVENSSATTTADTATRRSSGAGLAIDSTRGSSLHARLDAHGDFDGGGSTRRANRFLAALTVSVREVLPNGDLRVEGEQVLSLNEERQTVRVQGRVRRIDISEGNIVLSSRLADAQITLVGDGDLTERQRRSWWKRAIDWMGL